MFKAGDIVECINNGEHSGWMCNGIASRELEIGKLYTVKATAVTADGGFIYLEGDFSAGFYNWRFKKHGSATPAVDYSSITRDIVGR